jgi:exopolysaccharide biosynthesis polyprenyl glycosylphosphotransferase
VSDQLASSPPGVERRHELSLALPARPLPDGVRLEAVWVLVRAITDAVLLTVAAAASGIAAASVIGTTGHGILLLATLATFLAAGSYRPRMRLRLDDELRRVVGGLALACMGVAGALLVMGRHDAGDALVRHWLVASAIVVAGRIAVAGAQRAVRTRVAAGAGRALIVGAGRVGHLTAKRLLDEPQLGLRPIGFLDKEPLAELGDPRLATPSSLPVLGASWDLEQVVRDHGVDTVVVAFSTAPHHVMLDLVRRSWALGASVLVVPRLYEVEGRRIDVEHLGALPLVALQAPDPRGAAFAVKYALDRAVACVALLALAPVLAVVALAVRCSLGRPILFSQQRVGRDGRVFRMLKFRTMRGTPTAGEADAGWAEAILAGRDGEPAGAARDPRRTRVGNLLRKLSLDELPQFWNVVRGDMSLVGPRPERLDYVRQFEDIVDRYADRHRVKSGLTGWAQVHGLRGETSLADRVEWDNFYIENWSFWLDVKILVMTLPAMLGRRGGR